MTAPPAMQQATLSVVLLPALSKEDQARIKQIKDAWRGYRGEFDPLLDKEEGSPDFNIYDNRLAPIVDKGVSWLFGQQITITVKLSEGDEDTGAAAGDDAGTNAAQDYLNDALGDLDDFMTMLSEGALNGGVAGHAFWKLVPPDPENGQEYARIVPLNSENVWCETDPDDCKEVLAFNIQYPVKDARTQKTIWRRQRIARTDPDTAGELEGEMLEGTWTIGNYEAETENSTRWRQVGPLEPWLDSSGQPWPWPPMVENPNLPNPNELWGRPDTTPDLIGMNRNINLVQSITAKLLWFYSSPILWSNLDQRQVIRARPGYVTGLGPNGTMDAIEAHGDIAQALAFVASLRSNMDEESRVPAVAFGRLQDLGTRVGSGIALRTLLQPLLEKTETKRRLYGRAIRDLCQRVLALGGYGDGENLPVEIAWPTLIPVDEVQELQGAQIKQALGYPDKMIVEGLGDDYDEWLALKEAEDKQKQAQFDMGQGPAPEANAFARAPLPPGQQGQQPMMNNQQPMMTGGQ